MMMIIIDNTLLHYYYDSYYYYHHYYYSTTATTMTASITTTISAVILSRFSRHGHSLPVYPTCTFSRRTASFRRRVCCIGLTAGSRTSCQMRSSPSSRWWPWCQPVAEARLLHARKTISRRRARSSGHALPGSVNRRDSLGFMSVMSWFNAST